MGGRCRGRAALRVGVMSMVKSMYNIFSIWGGPFDR